MIVRATAATLALIVALSLAACSGDPAPRYNVTVSFNDRYTDAGGDEVSSVIMEYDEGADIRLQESFPPVLRATVSSRRADLCDEMLRRIGSRPDVASMDCQPVPEG